MIHSVSRVNTNPIPFGMGIKYSTKDDYAGTVDPRYLIESVTRTPPNQIGSYRVTQRERNTPTTFLLKVKDNAGNTNFSLEKKIVAKLNEIGADGFEYIPPVEGEVEK